MTKRFARGLVAAIAAAALGGCTGCNEMFVVLQVEDPEGLAASAASLGVGEDADAMSVQPLESSTFPVSQTQASTVEGDREVWVEALTDSGEVLGRDRVILTFQQGAVGSATATLQAPCSTDSECDNGLFCDGVEVCEDRVCVSGEVPCPASPFACFVQGCNEDLAACTSDVDHTQCEAGYCNPAVGCVPGDVGCLLDGTEDPACADGFVCNGNERCEGFHCVAGIPPTADDDNVCTIDTCTEPGGPTSVNVPDGNACTQSGGGAGICLAGACISTGCGDGFLDLVAGEACDDGNANSDTEANACRTDCSLPSCGDGVQDLGEPCDDGNADETDLCITGCALASCGDGHVQADVEACDDGAQNNDLLADACRTDCAVASCGDGVTDTGEACDDGNASDDDPCLTTCEENVCGDGFTNFGTEACDDGNDDDTDGCVQGCAVATCGDGFVQASVEPCDDGNLVTTDACLPGCLANVCGDGLVNQAAEDCDDANTTSADGCSSTCRFVVWAADLGGAVDPGAGPVAWTITEYPPQPDAGPPDAGYDGGPDAGTVDAGPVDSGAPDSGAPDSGPDAGPDGGADAGSDGGPDAGTADGGFDGGYDAGYDAGPQPVDVTMLGVTTTAGDVVAIDARDGSEVWRYATGETVVAPPVVGTVDRLYVLTLAGTLLALPLEPSALPVVPLWTASLGKPTGGSHLAVAQFPGNDKVIAVDEEGAFHFFRGADGVSEPMVGVNTNGNDLTYPHSVVARDYEPTAACTGCRPTLTNGALWGTIPASRLIVGAAIVPLDDALWFWNFDRSCEPLRIPYLTDEAPVGHLAFRGADAFGPSIQRPPGYLTTSLGSVFRGAPTGPTTSCTPDYTATRRMGVITGISTPPSVGVDPYGAGEVLYAGADDGQLHRMVWAQVSGAGPRRFLDTPGFPLQLDGAMRTGVALGGEFGAYVATEAGTLYSVEVNGEIAWSMPLSAAPSGSPLVRGNVVYALAQDGRLTAFERGEARPPLGWWSREGGNEQARGATPSCTHVTTSSGAGGAGLLTLAALLWVALGRGRRRAKR